MSNIISVSVNKGIDRGNKEVNLTTFKELQLEEKHIEEFMRVNISEILEEENLLIIGRQVVNQENGRSDLTAIDENGNIVLIEIKRDLQDIKSRKESFEFQAIRYAASNAKIKTVDEVVDKIYAPYIEKYADEYEKDLQNITPKELATRKINTFLEENKSLKTFNLNQRIILVASEFDIQTLSAVAWLTENNIDIACFTIQPIQVDGNTFLKVDKILPVMKSEDFYTNIKERNNSKSSSIEKGTRIKLPQMDKLFDWGIIKKGDQIYIKNSDKEDSKATVKDSSYVEYKGEKIKFNQWGQKVKGWSSICIYEWAIKVDNEKTLDELRKDKMNELGLI